MSKIILSVGWLAAITYRQFHQRRTHAFFVRKFVQSQTLSREKYFVQKMCT